MYLLLSQIAHFFSPTRNRIGHALIPRQLFEKAEARGGSNPRQAQELRGAALAYLRVVR